MRIRLDRAAQVSVEMVKAAVMRIVPLIRISQMPLAQTPRLESGSLKALRHKVFIEIKAVTTLNIVCPAQPGRRPARHQSNPRRPTDGKRIVIVQRNAVGRQAVDVRSLNNAGAITDIGPAHIIGDKHHKIGEIPPPLIVLRHDRQVLNTDIFIAGKVCARAKTTVGIEPVACKKPHIGIIDIAVNIAVAASDHTLAILRRLAANTPHVVIDPHDIALRAVAIGPIARIAALWIAALSACAVNVKQRIAARSGRLFHKAECLPEADINRPSRIRTVQMSGTSPIKRLRLSNRKDRIDSRALRSRANRIGSTRIVDNRLQLLGIGQTPVVMAS